MIDAMAEQPEPTGKPYEIATALLVGLIAVIVAVLVVLEVAVSHEGARAEAAAARLASLTSTRNYVSQAPFGFEISKTLAATKVAMEGTSRQLVGLQGGDISSPGRRGRGVGGSTKTPIKKLFYFKIDPPYPPYPPPSYPFFFSFYDIFRVF